MTFDEFWEKEETYLYLSDDIVQIKMMMKQVWDAATKAERERCAGIVREYGDGPGGSGFEQDVGLVCDSLLKEIERVHEADAGAVDQPVQLPRTEG